MGLDQSLKFLDKGGANGQRWAGNCRQTFELYGGLVLSKSIENVTPPFADRWKFQKVPGFGVLRV